MSQQGGRPARPEDDWWGQLYDDSAEDTGPTAAPDSLDDRFASAKHTVTGRPVTTYDGAQTGRAGPPPEPPVPPREAGTGARDGDAAGDTGGGATVSTQPTVPWQRAAQDPATPETGATSGAPPRQRSPWEPLPAAPPAPSTPPTTAGPPRPPDDQPPTAPSRPTPPTPPTSRVPGPALPAPASLPGPRDPRAPRTPTDRPAPDSVPPTPPSVPRDAPAPASPPAEPMDAPAPASPPTEPSDPPSPASPLTAPSADRSAEGSPLATPSAPQNAPAPASPPAAPAPASSPTDPLDPPDPASPPAEPHGAPSPASPLSASPADRSAQEPRSSLAATEPHVPGPRPAEPPVAASAPLPAPAPSLPPPPPPHPLPSAVDYVGSGPPTYDPEPTALPAADPDGLGELVADTVLDGARYGACTLRAVSLRGDSARYRGEPRRDSLLTARFGTGEQALVLVAMATGVRGTPGAHLAAAEACRWIGRAVGRSHHRLVEDIRAARRGELKSGLHRLTDRSLGRLRASAAEQGVDPEEYTASLRCLLLPADPDCRTRVFFGVGDGGLFRLRDGEWQDIEPRVTPDATGGAPVAGFGSPPGKTPAETPAGDRLTLDFGIPTPPSPYEPAPEPPREPFRFRASVARPGDALVMCTAGLADPLRGEAALCAYLARRWSGRTAPGLAAFLADAQVRVKGYADDRTAAAVWEA